MPSIFTKIIAREIPADILHEDDVCLAFRDINPQAPTHFLVIPKKEIVSLAELTDEDEQIVGRCMMAISKIAAAEGRWRDALTIAARFPNLGDHKAAIPGR